MGKGGRGVHRKRVNHEGHEEGMHEEHEEKPKKDALSRVLLASLLSRARTTEK